MIGMLVDYASFTHKVILQYNIKKKKNASAFVNDATIMFLHAIVDG